MPRSSRLLGVSGLMGLIRCLGDEDGDDEGENLARLCGCLADLRTGAAGVAPGAVRGVAGAVGGVAGAVTGVATVSVSVGVVADNTDDVGFDVPIISELGEEAVGVEFGH